MNAAWIEKVISELEGFASRHSFLVSGSRAEQELVNLVEHVLDGLERVEYGIDKVHVESWRPIAASIEYCGGESSVVPWPRCSGGSLVAEGVLVGLEEALSDKEDLSGYIVYASPMDRREARRIYSLLAPRRPSAVVFRWSGSILALTEPPFTLTHTCASSIPLVSLSESRAKRLAGCRRARLFIQDGRGTAEGLLVEAWRDGREPALLVAASLDYLGEPRSHARAIAGALLLFQYLAGMGRAVRLLLLPASELGDPLHPGYLAGYGARVYSAALASTPLRDDISLAIYVTAEGPAGLVYPRPLASLGGSRAAAAGWEDYSESPWSSGAVLASTGLPVVLASMPEGYDPVSWLRGVAVEAAELDWRRLVDVCTSYFYSEALKKPTPRLHSVVYKLRRVAEKATEKGDFVGALAACRVLLEAGHRLCDKGSPEGPSFELFPPISCLGEGCRLCLDVFSGESYWLRGGGVKLYGFLERQVASRIENLYEDYYMRGLLEKGSL